VQNPLVPRRAGGPRTRALVSGTATCEHYCGTSVFCTSTGNRPSEKRGPSATAIHGASRSARQTASGSKHRYGGVMSPAPVTEHIHQNRRKHQTSSAMGSSPSTRDPSPTTLASTPPLPWHTPAGLASLSSVRRKSAPVSTPSLNGTSSKHLRMSPANGAARFSSTTP